MQRPFRHKKKFGQNFLTDPALLKRIAAICSPERPVPGPPAV